MTRPELNRLAVHSGLEALRDFARLYAGKVVAVRPDYWDETYQRLYDGGALIVDVNAMGNVTATYRKEPTHA